MAGWLLHSLFSALIAQAVQVQPSSAAPRKPHGSGSSSNDPISYVNGRPVVHTPYGDLRGAQKRTTSAAGGVMVDSFLGIPYAMPPVGNLRFSPPVPAAKWSGIREAVDFGNECVQLASPEFTYNISDKPVVRTEDCLYLNVYRPVTNQSDFLPVMVWIHGGGFVIGAGSQYDASDIASKGVIVVTINYRLDIFGYLSNGDDVIPGNYGMLDQVRALEWVHFSIKSFGGDPGKVTIFGESAGSASVSLLALSPFTKGLFQRAIMESGSSMCPWSLVQPTNGVTPNQMVNLVGTFVGCTDKDITKKLQCFRKVEAEALLNASVAVKNALGLFIHMPPVVEKTYGFLPDYPERLLMENKFNHVDTIHGFNKAENGFQVVAGGRYSMTKQDFLFFLKSTLSSYSILGREAFMEELYQSYVGNDTDGHDILMQSVNALSDINFKGPALVEARIQSTLAPEKNHFVYEFAHKPSTSPFPAWMPPVHSDEIPSVFGVTLKQFQVPGKQPSMGDQIVSKEIQTMWTNFAKHGNPTITVPVGAVAWSKYDSQNEYVLTIKEKSDVVSFSNHISQQVIKKLKSLLSVSIPDSFVG